MKRKLRQTVNEEKRYVELNCVSIAGTSSFPKGAVGDPSTWQRFTTTKTIRTGKRKGTEGVGWTETLVGGRAGCNHCTNPVSD